MQKLSIGGVIGHPHTPYDSVELSADRDFGLTSGSISELKSVWGATR